jgi:transcriptional regulator with XRE-family HTH domain
LTVKRTAKLTSDTFGRRLAAIRQDRGLTEAELGTVVGKSKTTICAWEHGATIDIAAGDVTRCARALRCRRGDLLAPLDAPIPAAPSYWPRMRRRIQQRSAGELLAALKPFRQKRRRIPSVTV